MYQFKDKICFFVDFYFPSQEFFSQMKMSLIYFWKASNFDLCLEFKATGHGCSLAYMYATPTVTYNLSFYGDSSEKIHNIHSFWQAFSSGTDTTCFNNYKVSCHWDLNPTSHIMWGKHSTTEPPMWFTDKIKVKRIISFVYIKYKILTMNLSKFLLILIKQLANLRLRNEPASWALFTCWLILTSMYMELLQISKQ